MGWSSDFDPAMDDIFQAVSDNGVYIVAATGERCSIPVVYEPEGQVFGTENAGAGAAGLYNGFSIRTADIAEPTEGDKIIHNNIVWVVDDVSQNFTDHLETFVIVVKEQ